MVVKVVGNVEALVVVVTVVVVMVGFAIGNFTASSGILFGFVGVETQQFTVFCLLLHISFRMYDFSLLIAPLLLRVLREFLSVTINCSICLLQGHSSAFAHPQCCLG